MHPIEMIAGYHQNWSSFVIRADPPSSSELILLHHQTVYEVSKGLNLRALGRALYGGRGWYPCSPVAYHKQAVGSVGCQLGTGIFQAWGYAGTWTPLTFQPRRRISFEPRRTMAMACQEKKIHKSTPAYFLQVFVASTSNTSGTVSISP